MRFVWLVKNLPGNNSGDRSAGLHDVHAPVEHQVKREDLTKRRRRDHWFWKVSEGMPSVQECFIESIVCSGLTFSNQLVDCLLVLVVGAPCRRFGPGYLRDEKLEVVRTLHRGSRCRRRLLLVLLLMLPGAAITIGVGVFTSRAHFAVQRYAIASVLTTAYTKFIAMTSCRG